MRTVIAALAVFLIVAEAPLREVLAVAPHGDKVLSLRPALLALVPGIEEKRNHSGNDSAFRIADPEQN